MHESGEKPPLSPTVSTSDFLGLQGLGVTDSKYCDYLQLESSRGLKEKMLRPHGIERVELSHCMLRGRSQLLTP